jgi:hypothetical protein
MDSPNLSKSAENRPTPRHWPRRILFLAACLATLVALFYTMENWRGKRAWERCRRELEAGGANFDWKLLVPGPVPDNQNVFKAPHMAEWFTVPNLTEWSIRDQNTSGSSNRLKERFAEVNRCLATRCTNLIAKVSVVAPGTVIAPEAADVVVPEASAQALRPSFEVRKTVGQALQRMFGPSNRPPSLQGAKSYSLFAQPLTPPTPLRVVVLGSNSPPWNVKAWASYHVMELFPVAAFGPIAGANASVRAEASGGGSFEVHLQHPQSFGAADYLACTDALRSEFDVMREALKRPIAKMDGDYEFFFSMPVPNFVVIRNVAQTLSQRAQCYLLLGQPQEALRELTLLHGVSRLLEPKPTALVSAMINVAVTGIFISTVSDGLRLRVWQEQQLTILEQQLGEIRLLSNVTQALEAERAGSTHLLETAGRPELTRIFEASDPKRSLWRKVTDPNHLLLRFMPRGWLYQNMVNSAASFRSFFEAIDVAHARISPQKMEDLSHEARARSQRLSPYSFLTAAALPNFVKATQTMAARQTMAEQALLACALERYRLARGEYPETLAALSPQFVQQLPTELVNAQPFHYRRLDDGHFLLYSVGWNKVDDGGVAGKTSAEGDWVWQ